MDRILALSAAFPEVLAYFESLDPSDMPSPDKLLGDLPECNKALEDAVDIDGDLILDYFKDRNSAKVLPTPFVFTPAVHVPVLDIDNPRLTLGNRYYTESGDVGRCIYDAIANLGLTYEVVMPILALMRSEFGTMKGPWKEGQALSNKEMMEVVIPADDDPVPCGPALLQYLLYREPGARTLTEGGVAYTWLGCTVTVDNDGLLSPADQVPLWSSKLRASGRKLQLFSHPRLTHATRLFNIAWKHVKGVNSKVYTLLNSKLTDNSQKRLCAAITEELVVLVKKALLKAAAKHPIEALNVVQEVLYNERERSASALFSDAYSVDKDALVEESVAQVLKRLTPVAGWDDAIAAAKKHKEGEKLRNAETMEYLNSNNGTKAYNLGMDGKRLATLEQIARVTVIAAYQCGYSELPLFVECDNQDYVPLEEALRGYNIVPENAPVGVGHREARPIVPMERDNSIVIDLCHKKSLGLTEKNDVAVDNEGHWPALYAVEIDVSKLNTIKVLRERLENFPYKHVELTKVGNLHNPQILAVFSMIPWPEWKRIEEKPSGKCEEFMLGSDKRYLLGPCPHPLEDITLGSLMRRQMTHIGRIIQYTMAAVGEGYRYGRRYDCTSLFTSKYFSPEMRAMIRHPRLPIRSARGKVAIRPDSEESVEALVFNSIKSADV